MEILPINNVNDTFSYGAVWSVAFQSLLNLLQLWLLTLSAWKRALPETLRRAGQAVPEALGISVQVSLVTAVFAILSLSPVNSLYTFLTMWSILIKSM